MKLKDILDQIKNSVIGRHYTNTYIYKLLFIDIEDITVDYEERAKKVMSGKIPLTKDIAGKWNTKDGYDLLSHRIREKYLSQIRCHNILFMNIKKIIQSSDILPKDIKTELLYFYNPELDTLYELADFLAICIIYGNYVTAIISSEKNTQKIFNLNLSYMNLLRARKKSETECKIYKAVKRDFDLSRKKDGRFHSLNIIKKLLPNGYIVDNQFSVQGKNRCGETTSLIHMCNNSTNNIAIIGEGGIGKTTFLQQVSTDYFFMYEESNLEAYIPIYIELNRCPSDIFEWREDSLNKTNFITRYVGALMENHSSLNEVSSEVLSLLEKEFQYASADGKPKYLFLLDGFNEVANVENQKNNNLTIRSLLSNEISVFSMYPNVRVISTSRKMQTANYASRFENIELVGLNRIDIIAYLKQCFFKDVQIGRIIANEDLMLCLRIPLFLCIFSATFENNANILPESRGEILYTFFHKESKFYNEKQISIQKYNYDKKQISLILDFVLPYVAWDFEKKHIFSVTKKALLKSIEQAFLAIESIFLLVDTIPLKEFDYDTDILKETIYSFYSEQKKLNYQRILFYIEENLGICYRYKLKNSEFNERIQYAFIHHYFRDYFAAIFDVRILQILKYLKIEDFNDLINSSINSFYWHDTKCELISQILSEHRNKPIMDTNSENWFIPTIIFDEQEVLLDVLDFCRQLTFQKILNIYLLQNIITIFIMGRGELSGLDLSNLDLRKCNFFNVTCSKKGKTKYLTTCFNGSYLDTNCFNPNQHKSRIIKYMYHMDRCYTIDNGGIIKCWDIYSGKEEFTLISEPPSSFFSHISNEFMCISNDGQWLAAIVQQYIGEKQSSYINLFDLYQPSKHPIVFNKENVKRQFEYFTFSEDNKYLLCLIDNNILTCHSISDCKLVMHKGLDFILFSSRIYAKSCDEIYIFTCTYSRENIYKWDITDENIECHLFLLLNKSLIKKLYSFISIPNEIPLIDYNYGMDSFILFNYGNMRIERLDCSTLVVEEIMTEVIPPIAIYSNSRCHTECYVMYSDICYNVDVSQRVDNGNRIVMQYQPVIKNRNNQGNEEVNIFQFNPGTRPSSDCFIVMDDQQVYEFNVKQGSILFKYNTAIYDCIDLFSDSKRGLGILVHQKNGITVFKEGRDKIYNSYCFMNRGYDIDQICYQEDLGLLVIVFTTAGHEYVELLYLDNSKIVTIYSTISIIDRIQSISVSVDSKYILIALEKEILEYDIKLENITKIIDFDTKSRIIYAYYENDRIEVFVSSIKDSALTEYEERVEYYYKSDGDEKYEKELYYYPLELNDDLHPYFIYQNGDLGTYSENNMSSNNLCYWITRGFFFKDKSFGVKKIEVDYYTKNGNRFISKKSSVNSFEHIFVKHNKNLLERYENHNDIKYHYLADNFSKILLVKENKEIIIYNNLKTSPKKIFNLNYEYIKNEDVVEMFWDYVIPFGQKNIMCCYDTYHIIIIDMNTHSAKEIKYTPGVSINKCSFKNIYSDTETKKLILQNGGNI